MDKMLAKARRLAVYFYEFLYSTDYEVLPKETKENFNKALEFWSLLGDLDTPDLDRLVPDNGMVAVPPIRELEEGEELSQDYIDGLLSHKWKPTKSIKDFRARHK